MPDSTSDRWPAGLAASAGIVRGRAYAPYSGYRVGAVVQDETGATHHGVNVENASYGATICAERAAILAMVAAGGTQIVALAVATSDGGTPCGMCLQVIAEFADPDLLLIVLADENGAWRETTFAELFPRPFASAALERIENPAR